MPLWSDHIGCIEYKSQHKPFYTRWKEKQQETINVKQNSSMEICHCNKIVSDTFNLDYNTDLFIHSL